MCLPGCRMRRSMILTDYCPLGSAKMPRINLILAGWRSIWMSTAHRTKCRMALQADRVGARGKLFAIISHCLPYICFSRLPGRPCLEFASGSRFGAGTFLSCLRSISRSCMLPCFPGRSRAGCCFPCGGNARGSSCGFPGILRLRGYGLFCICLCTYLRPGFSGRCSLACRSACGRCFLRRQGFLERSRCLLLFLLQRLGLGIAPHSDNLLIADRLLAAPGNDHQPAALWAEIGHRALPDREVAGRIIRAAVKDALLLPGLALHQVAAAEGTERARFIHEGASVAALGEPRAGDKTPEAASANNEFTPTVRALLIDLLHRLLHTIHLRLGLLHRRLEAAIEITQKLRPGAASFLDIIKVTLHLGGKTDIHDLGEVLVHHLVDRLAQPGRHKTALLLVNIATILNGTQDRDIGAGAANALLLKLLD